MSLKTDYLDGASGFTQKMQVASDAGASWVVSNRSNIVSKLQEAAGKGLKKFTVSIVVTFEPNNLRLKGLHWKSFQSGVIGALIAEEIHAHEVTIDLNKSDNVETKIDLIFDFTSTI